MELKHIILNLNWYSEGAKVYDFKRKDASMYKGLGIASFIISIVGYFFFPVAMFFAVPMTVYMWYTFWKIRRDKPFAYLVEIEKKECWYKKGRPVSGADNTLYYYVLHTKIKHHWEVCADRLNTLAEPPQTGLVIRLNAELFEKFSEGQEAFFVFTPANDLLAYLNDTELFFLGHAVKNNDGTIELISTSVPQEISYPPTGGFQLRSNLDTGYWKGS